MIKIKAIKEFMRLYPEYKSLTKRQQVIKWIEFTSVLYDDCKITQEEFDAWATPSYFRQ